MRVLPSCGLVVKDELNGAWVLTNAWGSSKKADDTFALVFDKVVESAVLGDVGLD